MVNLNIIQNLKKVYLSFSAPIRFFFTCWFYVALSLILALMYSIIQVLIFNTMHSINAMTHNIDLSCITGILIICLVYYVVLKTMNHFKYQRAITKLKSKKVWVEIVFWLLFVKVSQVAIVLCSKSLLHTTNQDTLNKIFTQNTLGAYFVILLSVLLAPLCEEFIFRWLAFKIVKPGWLAFLSGFLGFVLLHSPNNLGAWIIYGIMSLALTANYYRNGYKASYLLHFLINLTAIAIAL